MIARLWSAQTSREQAPAYLQHLKNHVLPTLHDIDGYAGAMLLERETGAGLEILVVTMWRSLDCVRAFAGPDVEQAVVADEAAALLTDFDRRVRHYELVLRDQVV